MKSTDAGNFVQVSVIDNGPGISKHEQSKLFKPFSKLTTNSHLNPNGNGLGLNICKMICQSLGGDIEVTSKLHVETIFSFWVKLKRIEEENAVISPGRDMAQLEDNKPVATKTAVKMKSFLGKRN